MTGRAATDPLAATVRELDCKDAFFSKKPDIRFTRAHVHPSPHSVSSYDVCIAASCNVFALSSLQVTVTNTGDGCITDFPGTSSAAPIAAGILALALEVK